MEQFAICALKGLKPSSTVKTSFLRCLKQWSKPMSSSDNKVLGVHRIHLAALGECSLVHRACADETRVNHGNMASSIFEAYHDKFKNMEQYSGSKAAPKERITGTK